MLDAQQWIRLAAHEDRGNGTNMDADAVRKLVHRFDPKDSTEIEAVCAKLRPLGEAVLPFFREAFPNIRHWQGHAAMIYYATPFARTNDDAFELGVLACKDRSRQVRYRGCALLAYSLRREALPILRSLLNHPDSKTVEDARAAIDAIEHRNHNYFIDRSHTGRITWDVASDRL